MAERGKEAVEGDLVEPWASFCCPAMKEVGR